MSTYTTEVRYICEAAAGLDHSVDFDQIDAVITKAAPKIFNFDFPIFDESYRIILEKEILRHFYTREICEETVGLWKLRLWDKLALIMPYYNKLYLSETLKYNPLYDVDYTRTSNTQSSGESANQGSETTSDNSSNTETRNLTDTQKNLFSDTPQGAITNLQAETYLTDARFIEDKHTGTDVNASQSSGSRISKDSGTISNVSDFVEHIVGKQGTGSYANMIKEYRDALINVDQMVLNELSDLFMALW